MKNFIRKTICTIFATLSCAFVSPGGVKNVSAQSTIGDKTKFFGGAESSFVNEVVDAHDVELIDKGEFAKGRNLNKDYMLSLSIDRLVVNFRKTCGLTTTYEEYGGWAAYDVGPGNGEITLLAGLAELYAEDKDPVVLERINYFVDQIYECQEAYALKDPEHAGFVYAVPLTKFEELEKNAASQWNWMYPIAKNLEGYFAAYFYAGNQKAYDIWYKLGKFFAERTVAYDDATRERMFVREYGDIGICFFQLYLVTGEEVFKQAGLSYCDERIFNKLLNNQDPFEYIHCNRSIPVVRSALFAYLATGEEDYLTIGKNGFRILTEHRCFANGNTSETEDLHPLYETDTKDFPSAETCCAYNYMKICDLIYRITNEKYYLDYYENLLYNQILASIDWDTGMKTYYISMDNGFHKAYHTAETAFWCCTVTGWESFAKFNQNIYYTNSNSLIINQFINSKVNDPKTGLGLKQEHDYPNKPVVDIVVTRAANTNIKIRRPAWAGNGTQMSFNGKLVDLNMSADGYINISRDFKVGDNIKLYFPMEFRLSRLDSHTQPHSDAIMYGPIMMVGVIESIGAIEPLYTNADIGQGKDNKVKDELFYSGDSIFDNVEKVDDLKYLIKADNQEVLIEAFFKCYRERYIVYWDIYKTGSDEYVDFLNKTSNEKTTVIDEINVGWYFSEIEHNVSYSKTWIGNYATERNRGLEVDGYMQYSMKVEKGVDNILRVKHFGTDVGYTYSVKANSTLIGEGRVEEVGKQFYWKEYSIPANLTNTGTVVIRLTCTSGLLTTGIYEMQTTRCSLPLLGTQNINLNEGLSSYINLNDYLLDNITFNGTGTIKVEATFDGTNYVQIYMGSANESLKYLQQYKNIKITAVTNCDLTLTYYGAQVSSVEPISYVLANEDNYYPEQYATVNLVNAGSVRLRVDWSSANLTKGAQTGKAKLFNTSLEVDYQLIVKKLSDGLIAYYDFNKVNDDNTIDNKVEGGASAKLVGKGNVEKGYINQGVNLNGESYIELPQIDFPNNEGTISVWAKFNSTNNVLFQRVFDLGSSNTDYLTMSANGYVCSQTQSGRNTIAQSVYALKENVWYNLTLTIKDKLAISFINGVEVARNTQFNFNLTNVKDFTSNFIGKSHIEFTPMLNGVIDEFRVYNYAFSKVQVEGLYNINEDYISKDQIGSSDYQFETIEELPIDITYEEVIDPIDDDDIEPITPEVLPEKEPVEEKQGCGGSIGAASSIAVALAGAGIATLLKKKKEEEE